MSFVSYFKDVGCPTPGVVAVVGSFRSDGAGGIKAGSAKGRGYTVANGGSGLFTITFNQVGYELLGVLPGFRAADAGPWSIQGGDYSASAKTLQLRVFDGGVLTDPGDDVDNEITFVAFFKNTSI